MDRPLHVALIAKPGHRDSGVGRYVVQLAAALQSQGCQVTVVETRPPLPDGLLDWLKRWLRLDLRAFLENYPVWVRYPPADLYHLSSQNLATLLTTCPPPGRTVVTVHDLIPWLTRHDPVLRVYRHFLEAWFDRLALRSLRRADAILADSEFTRQSLLAQKGMQDLKVTTVWLGVN